MKLIHVQFSNVNTRHDSSLAFLFRELSASLLTDRDLSEKKSGFEKRHSPYKNYKPKPRFLSTKLIWKNVF